MPPLNRSKRTPSNTALTPMYLSHVFAVGSSEMQSLRVVVAVVVAVVGIQVYTVVGVHASVWWGGGMEAARCVAARREGRLAGGWLMVTDGRYVMVADVMVTDVMVAGCP